MDPMEAAMDAVPGPPSRCGSAGTAGSGDVELGG